MPCGVSSSGLEWPWWFSTRHLLQHAVASSGQTYSRGWVCVCGGEHGHHQNRGNSPKAHGLVAQTCDGSIQKGHSYNPLAAGAGAREAEGANIRWEVD
jgi:hypothetical protein